MADLHLGKVTHFRKNGIPVPNAIELENYERLSILLLHYQPAQVYILGDLFHSEYNSQWTHFEEFLTKFSSINFNLIMGNHDVLNPYNYNLNNLRVYKEELILGKLALTHHPTLYQDYYNLCGHIHPGVKIIGKGKQSMRLASFYFNKKQGILPAFGAFTGLHIMDVKSDDEVYGIIQNEVIKLNF